MSPLSPKIAHKSCDGIASLQPEILQHVFSYGKTEVATSKATRAVSRLFHELHKKEPYMILSSAQIQKKWESFYRRPRTSQSSLVDEDRIFMHFCRCSPRFNTISTHELFLEACKFNRVFIVTFLLSIPAFDPTIDGLIALRAAKIFESKAVVELLENDQRIQASPFLSKIRNPNPFDHDPRDFALNVEKFTSEQIKQRISQQIFKGLAEDMRRLDEDIATKGFYTTEDNPTL